MQKEILRPYILQIKTSTHMTYCNSQRGHGVDILLYHSERLIYLMQPPTPTGGNLAGSNELFSDFEQNSQEGARRS